MVAGFVVPDRGGEREEALQDAGAHAGGLSCAVAFEIELGFEGLVDLNLHRFLGHLITRETV